MVDDFLNCSAYMIYPLPLKAGLRLTLGKILYSIKRAITRRVNINDFKRDLTHILKRFIFILLCDTTNY